MNPHLQGPPGPPWDWPSLAAEDRRREFERLAEWVARLRADHAEWLALPDCWPLHEPLRSELAFFWYWQREVHQVGQRAAEGVHWHQELRRSAEAWKALSGCAHDEQPSDKALSRRRERAGRTEEHLREAVERPMREDALGLRTP